MSRRGRLGSLKFNVEWIPLVEPDVEAVKAALKAVMETSITFAKALWYERAQQLRIRETGAYLAGIDNATIRRTELAGADTELTLVVELVNTAPHAKFVEDGHAAFHLPSVIAWGSNEGRVKRGKNGPYLSIPFRHAAYASPEKRDAQGTTDATVKRMMPAEVYAKARNLSYTTKRNEGPIYRSGVHELRGDQWAGQGHAQFVAADRYDQGPAGRRRLGDSPTGAATIFTSATGERFQAHRSAQAVRGRTRGGKSLSNPAWESSKYSGLFKGGSKGHTAFMTVRTITPDSPGWNIPSHPGYGVARQVAAAMGSGPGSDRYQQLLVEAARNAIFGRNP